MSALAIVTALLGTALGPPPATVAAVNLLVPVARLQLVVKQVEILDDREGALSGQGEMDFFVDVLSCTQGVLLPCLDDDSVADEIPRGPNTRMTQAYMRFTASAGQATSKIITLDRVVPQAGDEVWGEDTAPEIGFGVRKGNQYVVRFYMEENDGDTGPISTLNDNMGVVFHVLDTGEQGLGIGTHVGRAVGASDGHIGDYIVTYEIRPMVLPDVEPTEIEVQDLPGSPQKRVCITMVNWGPGTAGPFEVTLEVDDTRLPDTRYTVGLLAAKTEYLACVKTLLPSAGQHQITAIVDDALKLTEYNERNNFYSSIFSANGPVSASGVGATAGPPTKPDAAGLVVSAIKVNGQIPDGKADCKVGKNSVTVAFKNTSSARADGTVVRLRVDDSTADVLEQSVPGLEIGQEREVRFGDVRLKKGEHQLVATVAGKGTADASNADNDALKVTARCVDAA
jgi:hypothetical protein